MRDAEPVRIDYARALAEAADYLRCVARASLPAAPPVEMRGDRLATRLEPPYPMPALDPSRR